MSENFTESDDTRPTGEEQQECNPDEPLPFKAEWEIGVHPAGDQSGWEHYHPEAKTEERAKEKARKSAKSDGMIEPMVYMSAGPYPPSDPASVGKGKIEEVFGDV